MPYIPEAARRRAQWVTLRETVERVRRVDGCDEAAAHDQIRALLTDHPIAAWDGPDLPMLHADGTLVLTNWSGTSRAYWRGSPDDLPLLLASGRVGQALLMLAPRSAAFWREAQIRDGKLFDPVARRWHALLLPRASVLKAWPPAPSAEAPTPPKRRVPRTDHSTADAPLVAAMRAVIERGEALDATAAARQLIGEAAGGATESTKLRRLVGRYYKTYPRT